MAHNPFSIVVIAGFTRINMEVRGTRLNIDGYKLICMRDLNELFTETTGKF